MTSAICAAVMSERAIDYRGNRKAMKQSVFIANAMLTDVVRICSLRSAPILCGTCDPGEELGL